MKQVKFRNGFIYYTKYKSSWATLNVNYPTTTKWSPSVTSTASQILGILSTKDWR